MVVVDGDEERRVERQVIRFVAIANMPKSITPANPGSTTIISLPSCGFLDDA
jgi:hypothetical protein